MFIQYTIKATIYNKILKTYIDLLKDYSHTLNVPEHVLYGNDHIIETNHIYTFLDDVLKKYLSDNNLEENSIDIESYEILSRTDNADVFFINSQEANQFTMSPTIVVTISKPIITIDVPDEFVGYLIEPTSIKWAWKKEEGMAYHLIDLNGNVIATLPIGVDYFIESALEHNKNYTRRLIAYNKNGVSESTNPITITTESPKPLKLGYEPVLMGPLNIKRWEDENHSVVESSIPAFQSGIGDLNDLYVEKTKSGDFFERYKLLSRIEAVRIFEAPVYPPVEVTVEFFPKGEVPEKHYEGDLELALEVSRQHPLNVKVQASVYEPVPIQWQICADIRYQKVKPEFADYFNRLSEILF